MQVVKLSTFLGLACLSDAFRVRPKGSKRSAEDTKQAVRVGTFGGHQPATWQGACNQTADGSLARAQCNLNVYEEAAKAAQAAGIDLLVLPEYGLINGRKNCHTDVPPSVGEQPCGQEGSTHAQVSRLSCIARQYNVALAANVITTRSGKKFITEIAYDKNGTVLAVYDKNRLFPGEGGWFGWAESGPFNPTVFQLFGQTWGIAICWEGMDPFAGWAQFHSFRDQGAQHILWSVGNTGTHSVLVSNARNTAEEVQMSVFGAMNEAMLGEGSTVLVDKKGANLTKATAYLDQSSLSALGYPTAAFIHHATV